MTTLLICGSRDASIDMLTYTGRCVTRAYQLHYNVICGDAKGVDEAVWFHCQRNHLQVLVYGITPKPRNKAGIAYYTQCIGADFLKRDRIMVDNADIVMAVWNGRSRGTKYTYDYAVKQGKEAHLVEFTS